MILTLSLLHLLDGVDKTEFFGDSADDEIAVGYLLREGICAAGVGCEGHVEEEVQGHQAEHRRQQNEIHRPRETVFINKPLKSSAVAKNLLLVLPGLPAPSWPFWASLGFPGLFFEMQARHI